MNRFVKLAVRVAGIANVNSFRSLVVPLLSLRSDRIPAQRNSVGFDHRPVALQLKDTFLLEHDNSVRTQSIVVSRRDGQAHAERQARKYSDAHVPAL